MFLLNDSMNLTVIRSPDTAKTMMKVPHAATKESVKKAFSLSTEVQATDPAEIDYTTVLTKVSAV